MAPEKPKVYIVDDEPAIRDSLKHYLVAIGFEVKSYQDGEHFLLENIESFEGCVLLDIKMPGRNGIEVLTEALRRQNRLKIIMMSGHADIAMSIKSMKIGAFDFIEKPYDVADVTKSLEHAFSTEQTETENSVDRAVAHQLLSKLTPREHEIAMSLAEGNPNKIVAYELGISVRTVEAHRARLMTKLNIRSLADLVRLTMLAP